VSSIDRFARSLLFGTTLEEKLSGPEESSEKSGTPSPLLLSDIPSFPGRPLHLSKPGKASFPSRHKLHEPSVRGEVLHFFANHELLAMELMALMLLRFPEAPTEFRQGIVRTIGEEQSHLKLYIGRMKELGVSFGDLPVSDYFWKTMRAMKSPLEFVVQMSLTFEQANLDFSLFYMKAVKETGDEKTAAILEKVFREEIGHVKHGLVWFNRWRALENQSESEWDAYLRFLPEPMTAQRAKGHEFSIEARRNAGFSEDFIRKLSLFSGSKGRPPVVWLYNPHCDSEIARAKPGFTATEGARRLSEDLQCMPLFLASEQDLVLAQKKPSIDWISDLQSAGFKTPEFSESVRAPKIGGLEPWGWSPDSFAAFQSLKEKLVDTSDGNSQWSRQILSHSSYIETGMGKLFSKSWSVGFLREWMEKNPDFGEIEAVGMVFSDLDTSIKEIERIFTQGNHAMLKAPYGTSGMQVREVRELSELKTDVPLYGWIKSVLSTQGSIVVEQFLNKVSDFSTQMEIGLDRTAIYDSRFFFTGSRNEYRGSYLGKKHPAINEEQTRFLFSTREKRTDLLKDLAERLRAEGYRGPVGIDSLLYRDASGNLKLKAIVEINPRWTMGRVALELEKKLAPGVSGLWIFLPAKTILNSGFESIEKFASAWKARHPLKMIQAGGGPRIQNGIVFTNDPGQAQEVLTAMGPYEAFTGMILDSATSTSPLSVNFKAGIIG
jgi:uncharacterized ferritin-like protein (DUF455 family)